MADRAKLRAMIEKAWAAPWVARTFEIDCPCPNGVHCGDLHTCEEVEAPEAYPASHEEPAGQGEGQCVVQIAVPGLESLARPTAEFIAAARNELPGLLDELDRAERERDEALDKWRRTHGKHSGRHPLLDGADGVLDQVRAVLEIPPGANVIEGARRLRAQAAMALERLERIGRLEGALRDLDLGAANRSAYLQHGMLCPANREIGPCDCGYQRIAEIVCALAADASPETKDKDR